MEKGGWGAGVEGVREGGADGHRLEQGMYRRKSSLEGSAMMVREERIEQLALRADERGLRCGRARVEAEKAGGVVGGEDAARQK